MVYVQLTGDAAALDEYAPYITGPWNFHESVPHALKQKLYDRLEDFLESGGEPAPPPSAALLRRMLNVCVGQPVPEEYVPLLRHEMQLAGAVPLEVTWRKRPPDSVLRNFKVAVIGAGESGICMGIKLLALGVKGDSDELRAIRLRHHNLFWGPRRRRRTTRTPSLVPRRAPRARDGLDAKLRGMLVVNARARHGGRACGHLWPRLRPGDRHGARELEPAVTLTC